MKRVTKTIEITYDVYESGELVKPSSPCCPLMPGVYRVTRCIEPVDIWTHGLPNTEFCTVFVEGHEYGISAEYLMLVEEKEHGGHR